MHEKYLPAREASQQHSLRDVDPARLAHPRRHVHLTPLAERTHPLPGTGRDHDQGLTDLEPTSRPGFQPRLTTTGCSMMRPV